MLNTKIKIRLHWGKSDHNIDHFCRTLRMEPIVDGRRWQWQNLTVVEPQRDTLCSGCLSQYHFSFDLHAVWLATWAAFATFLIRVEQDMERSEYRALLAASSEMFSIPALVPPNPYHCPFHFSSPSKTAWATSGCLHWLLFLFAFECANKELILVPIRFPLFHMNAWMTVSKYRKYMLPAFSFCLSHYISRQIPHGLAGFSMSKLIFDRVPTSIERFLESFTRRNLLGDIIHGFCNDCTLDALWFRSGMLGTVLCEDSLEFVCVVTNMIPGFPLIESLLKGVYDNGRCMRPPSLSSFQQTILKVPLRYAVQFTTQQLRVKFCRRALFCFSHEN